MSLGHGINMRLGIADETTYGTGVATATNFLELMDESFKVEQAKKGRNSLGQASQRLAFNSKKDVAGGFKFEFPYGGAEKILKHAMGAVAAPVTVSSAYRHDSTLTTALPVGFTAQVDRDSGAIGGTTVFSYEGTKITKMTLTQDMESMLIGSVECVCEDEALIASATTFAPAAFEGPDWGQLTTFTVNAVSLLGKLRSFEVSLENSLSTDSYTIGSYVRKEPKRNGYRKITGKISVEYDSITQLALYTAQTSFAISAIWTNGLSAANARSLTISLPVCTLQGSTPNTKDNGPYYLDLPFTAWRSAADNDEMTISTLNGISASQA